MIKNEKVKEVLKSLLIIFIAAIDALFFKLIIEGRGFFSLGASGVTLIASRLFGMISGNHQLESIIYMIIYLAINIPLFIFSYKKVAKRFTFYTALFVSVYSLVVGFIPASWGDWIGIDALDSLTSAVLIGIVTGAISAGVLFVGGCNGGISIVSTYLNVKKGKGIGIYNLIFNISILFVSFLIFRDFASIVYTMVYAFFSSLVLDKYYNRGKKILLEIVTEKKDAICEYLLSHSHHGCTIINAQGAYTHGDKYVVHTVISWFQLKAMSKAIKEIDPQSFIINLNVYAIKGDFYIPPIK